MSRRILGCKQYKSILGSDDLLCFRNVQLSVVIKQLAVAQQIQLPNTTAELQMETFVNYHI